MNKTAKEILIKLDSLGYKAYIVGGYPRDFLIGKTTNDIDICTNAKIKDILIYFPGVSNKYGSLNIKINDLNVDITSFREENSYKDRKPLEINYIDDLEQDLLRRDFTINTICIDKDGKIIDKLGGINDLNNKIIKVVGNPKKKIVEDPLRILRAIRFSTILDFKIDKTLEKEIIQNKELLNTLSAFRIKDEISKILISPNYKKGLKSLKKYKLCQELGLNFKNVVYTKDLCGMWAQIDITKNLPFTKMEKNNIVKIQELLDKKIINREVIYNYGLYLSLIGGEILGIDASLIYDLSNSLPIYQRKDLNISYNEICEVLNLSPSKKIKIIECELIKEVINGHIKNTSNDLKKYILANKSRWV